LAVYTDSPRYAATVLPDEVARHLAPVNAPDSKVRPLLDRIFTGSRDLHRAPWGDLPYHVLVSEFSSRSQYDQLIELVRNRSGLPDRVACIAGSGRDFHGYKGRSWAAMPGNIHLSVHLAPNRPVEGFQVAFTALAALSVVEALDQVEGLSVQPRIKWVNDILLGNAKVAGILAYTQSRDTTVTSAILGFGLNVETTPEVEPTPFVPEVASLRDFLSSDGPDLQGAVFHSLLRSLDRNYHTLLAEGAAPLLERYRDHSMVIGEEVTVCTEASDHSLRLVGQGRVVGLGGNLELILDKRSAPITGGRLIMGNVEMEQERWASEGGETAHNHPVPEGFCHA